VTVATPGTIALDPAMVITAGGRVVYRLAVKRRTQIVRGLNDGLQRQHDHQGGLSELFLLALRE
jgi:hypothetical protein